MSSYVCVCVCVCVTIVTPFPISLCIPGTRHKLHNASPPLPVLPWSKTKAPASRNTATEAREERAECLFMFLTEKVCLSGSIYIYMFM